MTRNSIDQSSIQHPERFAKFWRLAGELTTQLPRVGWAGIGFRRNQMDMLSAHHFNAELLTLVLGLEAKRLRGAKIDLPKAMKMVTVHDLSEFGGGDIGVPRASEFPILKDASRKIEAVNRAALRNLLGPSAGDKYIALALEEMEQTSDEAIFVKFIDRLEALLHMHRMRPGIPYDQKQETYYEYSVRRPLYKIHDVGLRLFCTDLLDAFVEEHKEAKLGAEIETCTKELHYHRRLIRLANELQRSKDIPRTGWVMAGMSSADTDTIADHGHVTAAGILALYWNLEELGIPFDVDKALEIALIQELGKMYGGDISPFADDLHRNAQVASHDIRRITNQILWSSIDTSLSRYFQALHDPSLAASGEGDEGPVVPRNHFTSIHEEALGRATDESRVVLAMSRMGDHLHYDLCQKPVRAATGHSKYVNSKIIGVARNIEAPQLNKYMVQLLTRMAEVIAKKKLRGPIGDLIVVPNA